MLLHPTKSLAKRKRSFSFENYHLEKRKEEDFQKVDYCGKAMRFFSINNALIASF